MIPAEQIAGVTIPACYDSWGVKPGGVKPGRDWFLGLAILFASQFLFVATAVMQLVAIEHAAPETSKPGPARCRPRKGQGW
jgi:hypothetical protein